MNLQALPTEITNQIFLYLQCPTARIIEDNINNQQHLIMQEKMNTVLDELITVCRCDLCGCVKGNSSYNFQNIIENSDNCQYNITPSYINFENTDSRNYCSTICWIQSGSRWGMDFIGHFPYDRKTKVFNDPIYYSY